jgi:DNA-directed RNA polymerase subunit RPC12/RpoP
MRQPLVCAVCGHTWRSRIIGVNKKAGGNIGGGNKAGWHYPKRCPKCQSVNWRWGVIGPPKKRCKDGTYKGDYGYKCTICGHTWVDNRTYIPTCPECGHPMRQTKKGRTPVTVKMRAVHTFMCHVCGERWIQESRKPRVTCPVCKSRTWYMKSDGTVDESMFFGVTHGTEARK